MSAFGKNGQLLIDGPHRNGSDGHRPGEGSRSQAAPGAAGGSLFSPLAGGGSVGNGSAQGTAAEDLLHDDASFRQIVAAVARVRPARAALLEVQRGEAVRARERAGQVRREAEAARKTAHSAEEVFRGRLEAEERKARELAAAAMEPHEQAAAALDSELAAARQEAIDRTSPLGRPFDPTHPEIEPLLRVARLDRSVVAAREGLPDPARDGGALFTPPVAQSMTGLVGVLTGVSLGVVSGALQPDMLHRQVGITLFSAAIGIGLAAFARKAIVGAHRLAAERDALREKRAGGGQLAAALLLDAAVLVVDLAVQREGLLKWAQVNGSFETLGRGAGAAGPSLAYYLIPLVVTLGYVAYSAFEGVLEGRRGPIEARLAEAQERDHRAETEAWVARADVQAAVAAVQRYRELWHRQESHRREAEQAAKPFLTRAADAAATLRSSVLPALSAEESERVLLAEREAAEAAARLRALLAEEVARLEPVRH